jgi:hypothetical protein
MADFGCTADKTGGFLGKIKIRNYTCGLAVSIVALGLYSYYMRELLASLYSFRADLLGMGFGALSVVLAWYAAKQVALWSMLASQTEIVVPYRGQLSYSPLR